MTLGTKDTVRAGLEQIALEYGAEELMIVTITYSHDARKRSYELIAEAFGAVREVESVVTGARIA